MKTDIEIARETKLNKIEDIAEKLGVPRDEVQNYGRYIAKVPIHLSLIHISEPTRRS